MRREDNIHRMSFIQVYEESCGSDCPSFPVRKIAFINQHIQHVNKKYLPVCTQTRKHIHRMFGAINVFKSSD
jgi:hypothetical protein